MGTGDGRKIRVVEHTPEVGRSLGSIRNYNPRTELHVKLPEMKRRRRADETSGVIADDEGYNGYFKLALAYLGEHAHVAVIDGASWDGTLDSGGNPNPCSITYANNHAYNNRYNYYYANAFTRNYTVAGRMFNAAGWGDGVKYIYLVFPFAAQPFLAAMDAPPGDSGTSHYYLVGSVTKETEGEHSRFTIHQEHESGVVKVVNYQYTGYFKILDASYSEMREPEGGGEPEPVTVRQVVVCDGRTWNGLTSAESICYVNNVAFSLPCQFVADGEPSEWNGTLFYLHYHAQHEEMREPEGGGEPEPTTVPASVTLESGGSTPPGDEKNAYYLIGQRTNGGIIVQAHAGGIPDVKWYMVCPPEQ